MKRDDKSVELFEYSMFGVWYCYALLFYVILILFSNIVMSLVIFLMGELSLWSLYSYKSKKSGKSYTESKYWAMLALALMYITILVAYIVLRYGVFK